MSQGLRIDDLELVRAVLKHGSLGAAARELLVSQPAASQRLAAIERRIGTRLFERDTTGARPTAAGQAFAAEAERILAQLASLPEHTLAAAGASTLAIGSIASLAGIVFSTLDAVLDDTLVQPKVDHGPAMIERVHEGALDAAFLTIASQTALPRGLTATELLRSELVLLLPAGAARPSGGRRPHAGQEIVHCTLDLSGATVHRRLAELGARPRAAATAEAAVRIARARRCAAVVPDLVARLYAEQGDEAGRSPVRRVVTCRWSAAARCLRRWSRSCQRCGGGWVAPGRCPRGGVHRPSPAAMPENVGLGHERAPHERGGPAGQAEPGAGPEADRGGSHGRRPRPSDRPSAAGEQDLR